MKIKKWFYLSVIIIIIYSIAGLIPRTEFSSLLNLLLFVLLLPFAMIFWGWGVCELYERTLKDRISSLGYRIVVASICVFGSLVLYAISTSIGSEILKDIARLLFALGVYSSAVIGLFAEFPVMGISKQEDHPRQ